LKLFLTCAIAIIWLMGISPASANFCRQVRDETLTPPRDRQICILNIKRSAKNYWQYRATTSIDGVKQPTGLYDCREKLIYEADGSISSFRFNLTGAVVCSLYRQ
jgi:hypothetical protein